MPQEKAGIPTGYNGGSKMLKAKKYLTSKVAKTKMGQNAIRHFLGNNGCNLINCLKAVAFQDKGKEGHELITDVLVLVCKGKILHDEKLITNEHRKEFVMPINNLAISVYKALEASKRGVVDIKPLLLKFAQLESLVCNLLKDHIKPKNVEKTHNCFHYFGSASFLTHLINDKEYHEFKTTFHKNFTAIMKERLEGEDLLPPPIICKQAQCRAEAAVEEGKFAGSAFCPLHHEEQYKRLLKDPDVNHFLVEAGASSDAFKAALKEGPANIGAMYVAIDNYHKAKPNIRRIFSEGIYEKYVHPQHASHKVECLSEACVKALTDTYKEGKEDGFDEARKELLTPLKKIFNDFMKTPGYQAYLAGAKLI